MNFITSLRSEMLKTKRTPSFYLTIIAAAFGPLMTLLDITIGEGIAASERQDFLNKLFINKFQMTGLLAFPMFLVLICTLLPQTEYKNNTWKQVLTSPQTKLNVFLAKFVNIQLLAFVFFVVNFLFTFVCGLVVHFKDPALHLFNQPFNVYDIVLLRVNNYLVLLSLCALQYWLGLQFKSFIIPIATGAALYFAGSLAVMQLKEHTILYLPYTMFLYDGLPEYAPYTHGFIWYSLGYMLLFLGIGFLSFRRKRMIG